MRRRRDGSDHRCSVCLLHRSVCVCALLPKIETRTRVVLLLHQLEVKKPTNTGRFALRCLPNSTVHLRGRAHDAPEPAALDTKIPPAFLAEAKNPVLLFPHPEGRPLAELAADALPLTLIVPDGTWSQAVRARKRIAGLAQIPCASLPTSLEQGYQLRHDPRPGHVSTLEAIAYALGILEGPAAEEALLRVLHLVVDRTLWSNGKLASHLVTGGLPAGAQRHNPRGNETAKTAPADRDPH
jgi:DTW domain-containing protein